MTDEEILSTIRDASVGISLASCLRDDVLIGGFQILLVAAVRSVLEKASPPLEPVAWLTDERIAEIAQQNLGRAQVTACFYPDDNMHYLPCRELLEFARAILAEHGEELA